MTIIDHVWDALSRHAESWGPAFLVWCVAIYFCLARRRQNPSAAIYLALAILTRILSIAVPALTVSLVQFLEAPALLRSPYLTWSIIGIHIIANAVTWILITMAVFARPRDDAPIGESVTGY